MDEDEDLLASLWGDEESPVATEESHSDAPKRTPSQAEEQPDPKRPRSAPAQASKSRQQAPPRATAPVIAPRPTPAPAGRTPFAAAAAPQANVAPQLDMSVEPHSGIRVRPATRKLSRDDVNSIAKQFAVRKIADLPQHFRGATAATAQVDWVTIGVLAKKKASKTSESGRTFHVWEISDLRPGSAAKSFSLFLFGDAAASAYKELEGALLLLVNPALMPPKDGGGGGRGGGAGQRGGGGGGASDTGLTFKLDSAQCVKRIGEASEYGMCPFQKANWSTPCGQWLNTSEGDVCARCAYAKLQEVQALERAALARGRGKGGGKGGASAGGASAGAPSGGRGGATGVGARGGAASIDHRAQNKAELDAKMASVSWKHRPQEGRMGGGMSTANERAALLVGPLSDRPPAPPPAAPRSAPAPLADEQRQQQRDQAAAQAAVQAAALRQRMDQKTRERLPLESQLPPEPYPYPYPYPYP